MDRVEASEPFAGIFARHDPFAWLEAQDGELFRDAPGRRTMRLELDGRGYFAKLHRGVGWIEVLKNLASLRRPVLDARQELDAVAALQRAGVPTVDVVAWGVRGRNPARRRSFLITREIPSRGTLDDLARGRIGWPEGAGRRQLIRQVAAMTRQMHAAGVNHRDLYLVHFLLTDAPGGLRLIDLHRAGVRTDVPRRWRIKDLAGLHFSAMVAPLGARDRLRFLQAYRMRPLRRILAEESGFWAAVERRGMRLWREGLRKGIVP